MSDSASENETSLSVEDATGLLDTSPDVAEADAPIAETDQPIEAEPTAEPEIDPEEAIELDPEDEGDPETPAIAAPQSWDAEERAVFATLPLEAQQVIVARESERDKAVNRAQSEAAEVRKRAEQEVQGVTQLRAVTEQVLTKAAQTFRGKWDNVDWQTWAQADPAAYVAGRAQFEAEQRDLAQLDAAHQAQRDQEMRTFQQAKAERIKTEAPELVDPVRGKDRVQKLESFLEANGIGRDIFPTLDAFTIGLAYDGMRYRDARARAKSQVTPTPAPTRAAVRPAAAQAVRSPQRNAEALTQRLRQTGSVEDAVALLNARS